MNVTPEMASTILVILFIHWIADFVMQTREQAKNKSHDNGALLAHTFTYSCFWVFPCLLLLPRGKGLVLIFWLITFVSHTITDYFTSRLNKYLWEKGDAHNFFVSVGFDQLLHYAQLFLTFALLQK